MNVHDLRFPTKHVSKSMPLLASAPKSLLRPASILGLATIASFGAFYSTAPMSKTSPMEEPGTTKWPTRSYVSRHTSWPYSPSDFTRDDPNDDSVFYAPARLVNHIDDHAIEQLNRYYASTLPRKGRILDFCSSWTSHYPQETSDEVRTGSLKITGMGMNKAELEHNPLLNDGRIVRDLNSDANGAPDIGAILRTEKLDAPKLDAATCCVSIDYLIYPREILQSLRGVMQEGGVVHLIISNRCFPTKAVRRWKMLSEEEKLELVGDYLHFAGFSNIEIIEVSGIGSVDGTDSQPSLLDLLRFRQHDPLWVVRGVNKGA